MNEISALPSNIVAWLKGREELKKINFMTEFPAVKKAVPLKNTTVAVGIEGMEIVDSFTENDDGVLVENEYCRQAKIKLRLSIHAPYSMGGEQCHDAFTDIIDCLTFASGLDITDSGCYGIISDRDTDAFVLSAWATVNASLCPAASSELDFPSFLNKELLCGSHINNTDIHLSQAQKSFLHEPFATGSFFGNGSASRSITLGFKPRIVIVCARGYPLIYSNHTNNINYAYAGVAAEEGASIGIEILSNGFKIKNTSGDTVKSSHAVLSEAGTTYIYIALK